MYNIFYSCKLRFNEFTNEISEKKLKIFCSFSKGKGISKAEISSEGTPCIRYGELYTHYNEKIENISSKTDVPINSLVFADYGDIIIPTSGETAIDLANASCIYEKNVAIGGDTTIIKTSQNGLYLSYYITSKKREIAKLAQGVSIVHLYASDLKEFKVNLPSKNEQDKIATFLSLIDRKIELLEKTLNLYKSLMKYYLKKIFSKEKILENGKHYKIKPLNKVTFYQEGPGVRNYQYKKEGIKLLNVGNFIQNNLVLNNTDRYISKEEAYGVYKHFLVDEGDLLIACSGIKAEYFDEKIAFARKEHLPLCMNTSTMRFKSLNSNELNLNYLKWFFQTEEFKKQIFKILTGSAQFNFGPTHLKYLKILILPIKEQILISNFLDLLKKYIDKNNNQIKLMNKLKKGLLEQMFC